jgi:hypothetical protein
VATLSFANCCDDCDCTLPLPHAHPTAAQRAHEDLVQCFARILSTPREPEDQARQLVQYLALEYIVTPRFPR